MWKVRVPPSLSELRRTSRSAAGVFDFLIVEPELEGFGGVEFEGGFSGDEDLEVGFGEGDVGGEIFGGKGAVDVAVGGLPGCGFVVGEVAGATEDGEEFLAALNVWLLSFSPVTHREKAHR